MAVAALRAGVCLGFVYNGRRRLAEVHAVGVNTQGHAAMSTFQVEGDSGSGPIPDWRSFRLDACSEAALSDVPSRAPRPDFRPGHGFRRIDAQV